MFAFTMIIGVLGVICWKLGLGLYFIGIFVVAVIANEVESKLKQNEYTQALNEFKEALGEKQKIEIRTNERNEKAKQAADNLTSKAFFEKKQVPVRIDKDTGAYIIDLEELLAAIDNYYHNELISSNLTEEELDKLIEEEKKNGKL